MNLAFVFVSQWNKNKRTMSTNEVWIDQQSNVCTKSKLHSSFYWNFVECLTQKLLVCSLKCQSFRHSFHARLLSSPIFQNLLQLLPAILEVLHSMRWPLLLCGYDSTIISSCISIRIEYSASMTQKCDLDWTL